MSELAPEKDGEDMPIKPVDFQIMLPRTVEMSKNQNDAINKAHAINKVQNATVQNEAELKLKQVYHKEKLFKADIKEKQKDGSRSSHKEEDKDTNSGEQQTGKQNQGKHDKSENEVKIHIDIRI